MSMIQKYTSIITASILCLLLCISTMSVITFAQDAAEVNGQQATVQDDSVQQEPTQDAADTAQPTPAQDDTTQPDTAEECTWQEAKDAYAAYLQELTERNADDDIYMEYSWYYLYDIDLDGVPELILQETEDPGLCVLKYAEEELITCGQYGSQGRFGFFGVTGEPGILGVYGAQGMWSIGLFVLEDDALVATELSENGFAEGPYPYQDAGFEEPEKYQLTDPEGLEWTENPDFDNMEVYHRIFG